MDLDKKISSRDAHPLVRKWMGEIDVAQTREKDWRREAREYVEIYEGKKVEQIPFNILFSNTETLAPALYARTPRPVADRRFKQKDPIGKVVGTVIKRGLEFLMDTDGGEYQPFGDAMEEAVLDALVPGRGLTRFRYDADEDAAEEPHGGEGELVLFESVRWDRFAFGYAEKWCDVPWVSFEHYFDKKTVRRHFGERVAAEMRYSVQGFDKEEQKQRESGDEAKTNTKTACVYEIWDKKTYTVRWISPDYDKGMIREDEDPLQLSGFFPIPEPLRLVRKANNLEPTAPYKLYENQAKQLNKMTVRLNRLIDACKVRGIYNGQLSEIEEVLKLEENGLVAATNSLALQTGLDKNIWMMPTEKIVATITQLFAARENAKQVIYEITGISDIMRGQSAASETLGAQEIKQNWGTMRLKRMQTTVQKYVCDCLKIMTEILGKHFSPETLAMMTEVELPTEQDVMQAERMVQAGQQMAQFGLPLGPQLEQEVAAAKALLEGPTWPKVMEILRSDQMRNYKIDIETNSTIDPEATEDKEQIAEVMNAISQFLNGVAPMVENGSMPFEVAKEMLLVITRRFRFGVELEDALDQMRPPQPQQDPNAAVKAEVEKQRMELDKQKHANEVELARMEMEFKREEHQLRMVELKAKIAAAAQMAQIKASSVIQSNAIKAQQGAQQLEHDAAAHEMSLEQQEVAGEQQLRLNEQQFRQQSRRQRAKGKQKEKVN